MAKPNGNPDPNMDEDDISLESFDGETREKVQKLLDKETAGLKNKRDELLIKLKSAKKDGDNDEVRALKARIEELELGGDDGKGKNKTETEELRRRIEEQANRKVSEAEEKATKAQQQRDKVIVDAALRKGASEVKVMDGLTDSVMALIKSKHTVEVNEDGEAEIDGQSVSEFMKDWAKTDIGKHHIAAQDNRGGGSNGNYRLAGQAGSIKTKADLKTPADKSAFIEEHGLDAFKALPAAPQK